MRLHPLSLQILQTKKWFQENWFWVLRGTLNSVALVVMAFFAGHFAITAISLNHIDDVIDNPNFTNWVNTTLWIISLVVAFFGSIIIKAEGGGFRLGSERDQRNREGITRHVWNCNVLYGACVLMMWIATSSLVWFNGTIGTQSGYVRVMDNGLMVSSGTTVPYDPRVVSSVTVPLSSEVNGSWRVSPKSGYEKSVSFSATVVIAEQGAALPPFLFSNRESLGWGNRDANKRLQDQRRFFAGEVTRIVDDALKQTLLEFEQGKLPGGEKAILLRVGDIVSQTPLPPWMKSLKFGKLSVDGWKFDAR